MKQTFITRNGGTTLTLLFAGWSMDAVPFADFEAEGSDLAVCYDYTNLEFCADDYVGYAACRVVAWSMGVWVASQVLPHSGLRVIDAVAFNGTEYVVDSERGIAPAIFVATLDGLGEASLRKFNRRMCGSAAALEVFDQRRPQRSIESLRAELRALGEEYLRRETAQREAMVWSRAVVAERDMIFTAENQMRGWAGRCADVRRVPTAHYDEQVLRGLVLNGKVNECR